MSASDAVRLSLFTYRLWPSMKTGTLAAAQFWLAAPATTFRNDVCDGHFSDIAKRARLRSLKEQGGH